MPSRSMLRTFALALTTVGAFAGVAQAGIIVTVGKPCPELNMQKPKPANNPSEGQRHDMFEDAMMSEGTRCVQMPDGSTKCGKSIRVETVNMLPADWRCIPVAKSVLYCETPTFGASPGAAGEGEFDPDDLQDEGFEDEEVEALGARVAASASAGSSALAASRSSPCVAVAPPDHPSAQRSRPNARSPASCRTPGVSA